MPGDFTDDSDMEEEVGNLVVPTNVPPKRSRVQTKIPQYDDDDDVPSENIDDEEADSSDDEDYDSYGEDSDRHAASADEMVREDDASVMRPLEEAATAKTVCVALHGVKGAPVEYPGSIVVKAGRVWDLGDNSLGKVYKESVKETSTFDVSFLRIDSVYIHALAFMSPSGTVTYRQLAYKDELAVLRRTLADKAGVKKPDYNALEELQRKWSVMDAADSATAPMTARYTKVIPVVPVPSEDGRINGARRAMVVSALFISSRAEEKKKKRSNAKGRGEAKKVSSASAFVDPGESVPVQSTLQITAGRSVKVPQEERAPGSVGGKKLANDVKRRAPKKAATEPATPKRAAEPTTPQKAPAAEPDHQAAKRRRVEPEEVPQNKVSLVFANPDEAMHAALMKTFYNQK